MTGSSPFALYIHWPFCVSKCPYCDFNSHVRASIDHEAWRIALLADLAHEAAQLPNATLGSIFFGGGTPSLMEPATVEALIAAATKHWPVSEQLEVTLEANPSSVEAARFADLARAGVNRVSLGIQSFDDAALAFLGRAHSSKEARAALDTAMRQFDRVNFDLIYALPDQTEQQWSAALGAALKIGSHHLSLYQLTIEPGTRFETLVAQNKISPLDTDAAANLFEITQSMTAAAGLPAYEVSNHAVPGEESRHNLTYWRYGDYAGIGPGAHGRRAGLATLRHKKPENWLKAVDRNAQGLAEETQLTPQESAREALIMGLRLAEGVDIGTLESRFGLAGIIDQRQVRILENEQLVTQSGKRLTVTPQGMLLLDAVLAALVTV